MQDKPQNIDDFLFDDDFNEYITEHSEKSKKRWNAFFEENEDVKDNAEKAGKIIRGLSSINDKLAEKELSDYHLNNQFEATWAKYRNTKSKTAFVKASKWIWRSIAVAATVIFIITFYILIDNFIDKNKSPEYSEIYVPVGKKSQLTMPDGTQIWINADTHIKYSTHFNSGERKLYLTGEAYFDVFRNKKLPFVVSVNGAEIKVLGTKFNVKSYPNDKTVETVLVEGKVELTREGMEKEGMVEMKPGDKTIFDLTTNEVVFTREDVDADVAWKDGKMVFRNTPLAKVCKDLSRHFNAEIVLDDDTHQLLEHPFTFTVENEPLSLVLGYLCQAAPLKYRIKYIDEDGEKGIEKIRYTISVRKN